MSDGLVERLRTHYKVECHICHHFNSDMSSVDTVLSAAADRIVELEEALLRARGWVDLAKPGKLRDFDLAYIDRLLEPVLRVPRSLREDFGDSGVRDAGDRGDGAK